MEGDEEHGRHDVPRTVAGLPQPVLQYYRLKSKAAKGRMLDRLPETYGLSASS